MLAEKELSPNSASHDKALSLTETLRESIPFNPKTDVSIERHILPSVTVNSLIRPITELTDKSFLKKLITDLALLNSSSRLKF